MCLYEYGLHKYLIYKNKSIKINIIFFINFRVIFNFTNQRFGAFTDPTLTADELDPKKIVSFTCLSKWHESLPRSAKNKRKMFYNRENLTSRGVSKRLP